MIDLVDHTNIDITTGLFCANLIIPRWSPISPNWANDGEGFALRQFRDVMGFDNQERKKLVNSGRGGINRWIRKYVYHSRV